MVNLTGRTLVITGSSRGFGLEMALAVIRAGGQVVISARSKEGVEEALVRLNAPDHASGLAVDVTDLSQVRALSSFAIKKFGHYDVWINNAGIGGTYGPTSEISPDTFLHVIQTNIMGTYHGSKVALEHFINLQQGKLINILGHGYKNPVPFQSAYASSKAWVRSFTLALSREVLFPKVGIFAFAPGMMLTDLLTQVDVVAGHEDRLKVFPTVIRILARHPSIAAQKAIWIASSATDGKTGKLFTVPMGSYLIKSVAKEIQRRLSKSEKTPLHLSYHSIPPYVPENENVHQ
jgi:NAD(P)-dependent dehydrogenase (short-subunit alcohol dehydrogenase family)